MGTCFNVKKKETLSLTNIHISITQYVSIHISAVRPPPLFEGVFYTWCKVGENMTTSTAEEFHFSNDLLLTQHGAEFSLQGRHMTCSCVWGGGTSCVGITFGGV
jgi:hypothetical protein